MTALEFDNWLHRKYAAVGKITAMSKRDRPFLSMISTTTGGGSDFNTPVLVSGGRGFSNTRANAQSISDTSAGNGAFAEWKNVPGEYKGSLQIKDREIAASKENFSAYARALGAKTDAHVSEFGGIMSRAILGPPGMYLCTGTISSGVVTITAAEADRVAEIELGDQIQASADDGDSTGHTLLGSSSVGYVIGVSRSGSTTTFTVSTTAGGSAGTPAGWTGTMYFYRLGEFKGGIDRGTGTHVIDSIQAWVPETEPSDTYKQVDRSADSRLSGVRQLTAEVTSLNIEETLENLSDRGRSRYGWTGTKKCFLHTTRFRQLSRSLETRRLRGGSSFEKGSKKVGEKEYASFSYNYISLSTQSGAYEIIDEPHMPADYALMTNPDDWEIMTYSGFPAIIDEDTNRILRKTTEDTYEFRETAYASFKLKKEAMISQTGRTALPAAA